MSNALTHLPQGNVTQIKRGGGYNDKLTTTSIPWFYCNLYVKVLVTMPYYSYCQSL